MNDRHPTSQSSQAPRREPGQATVEFALILPILALILFATLQFGTAFWQYQQLSAAASEGARKAAVSRTATNRTTIIQNAVRDAAPGLDRTRVGVTITSTWRAGDPVTIAASYPLTLTVMGRTYFNSNLVSRRTTRVES